MSYGRIRYNGIELKLARIKARIKQKEIAAAVGISSSALCQIENGGTNPRPETIEKIEKALKRRGVVWPPVQEATDGRP